MKKYVVDFDGYEIFIPAADSPAQAKYLAFKIAREHRYPDLTFQDFLYACVNEWKYTHTPYWA